MTDILFGQSYYLHFDPKLWQAMQPYPPLGTLYAASFMRNEGYSVALFDAMLAHSEDEWAVALHHYRPRFAVIYEDNTDHTEQYLAAGADFALVGEGEETLRELLNQLTRQADTSFSEIAGLSYTENGRHHHNSRRQVIRDLDSLPFPAWDLVDVERYRHIWIERHGYYSMNMATTRGCPYHCNWCAKPIWGQRYHSRSAENVAAEMKWLKATYQPDHIWFADDIMGLKPGWWEQLATQVEEKDAHVPFKCLSRADLILRSDEDVKALKRAGCDIVWLGAESGSQKILDAMEKGTTVPQIIEAAERLHAAGVKVGFFLQFGYPGETREDIKKTLQMVRDAMPDDVGMSVSYPLPGTRFYHNVRQQLGDKQNWVHSADLDMLYRGPFTTAFYRQLHVVLHKEFRSQRALQELRQVAAQPGQLRGRHLRQIAATAYRLATLPLARYRLDRLAALPHNGLIPMAHMSLEEAALPTPQTD